MIGPADIGGVIAAIATPFKDNEDLDSKGLAELARHLIAGGVHGIMAVGGTGEFPHLNREEKKKAIAVIAAEARGKVPVIANTSACSTREALQLLGDAKESGADAAIATPPYYFRLDDQALLSHFAALAAANVLPVVVYNNPLYTGNPMGPLLLSRFMEIPNIIGLKQSEADMGQLVEVIRLTTAESSLCTGIDSQFYPALAVGAKGIYSTAATVIPRQMQRIYTLYIQGNIEEARKLHLKIQVLNRFLEYDPGYVSPAKEALRMLGLPAGPVRRPMPELTEEQKEGLRQALSAIGEL
jgi:4-hydroxy-tetrahydrodipicolinate synthase